MVTVWVARTVWEPLMRADVLSAKWLPGGRRVTVGWWSSGSPPVLFAEFRLVAVCGMITRR